MHSLSRANVLSPSALASSKPTDADTHTLLYGNIVAEGRTVDEVLLAVMRTPRTFTREDTVEITCHGGMVASQAVLQTVLAAGARSALPRRIYAAGFFKRPH